MSAYPEIGDIVTFGSEYDGQPAGYPFVCVEINGAYEAIIEGAPSVMSFRMVPLKGEQLKRFQEWKTSGAEKCFSLKERLPV